MSLRRVGLSNSLSSQAKITNRRFTLSRVSLRRFPFPKVTGPTIIPNYIEEVFSTFLYTGNNGSQSITNGIDLSTKGGLVWIKSRTFDSTYGGAHQLVDTARGLTSAIGSSMLSSNSTDSATGPFAGGDASSQGFSSFNSTGFSVKNVAGSVQSGSVNTNNITYASWTFRKQPKFFDVQTGVVDGSGRVTVNHNLESVPGCIFAKSASGTSSWFVYHRSLPTPTFSHLKLNTSDAVTTATGGLDRWTVSSTSASTILGAPGQTYVFYLFAHDAGGFGATGSDNVISCGSFVDNVDTNINLGYEPQWILVKASSTASQWYLVDTMRGWVTNGNENDLVANSGGEENSNSIAGFIAPTATGFKVSPFFSATWIYIAIRRGPMKTPTSGTQVYTNLIRTGNGTSATLTGFGFPPDSVLSSVRNDAWGSSWNDKLRNATSDTYATGAEISNSSDIINVYGQNGITLGSHSTVNASGKNYVHHAFRRAPGFFDVVCFTTDGGTNQRVTHNLAVIPELIITKQRNGGGGTWFTYSTTLGRSGYVSVNLTNANFTGFSDVWGTTNPTSTDFGYNTQIFTNSPYTDRTIVCYLFASCPGVSKVGSYTGTGTTQQINCGFTAGARFVMIKRTDSTGDWYVWDTARGIVASNDPYLLLNSTAAEVTNTDYIDSYSPGFEISSAAPVAINASGGTFIFLAIA